MSDRTHVEVGSTIKIERGDKGWIATVSGPNNSSHAGKPYHQHATFDEAVAYIKSAFDVG